MSKYKELLDALEKELRAPKFRGLSAGAEWSVTRVDPRHLAVELSSAGETLRVDAMPLDPAEAPDARPRIVLRSSRGGSDYADHSVDGLAMGVLGMTLAVRQSVR